MGIETINKFEKTVVSFLNEFEGWDLKWSEGKYEHYDASGLTPKGHRCVMEMKFRNKYYKDKLLEKYKYDKLMEMDSEIVKLYFVSDPKGTYLYWINYLEMPKVKELYCPDTTLWTKKKLLKKVYLLTEDMASIVHKSQLYSNVNYFHYIASMKKQRQYRSNQGRNPKKEEVTYQTLKFALILFSISIGSYIILKLWI